jgi:hypothetical protein
MSKYDSYAACVDDPEQFTVAAYKEEVQQDATSNGGQGPSLNSSFHSRRG